MALALALTAAACGPERSGPSTSELWSEHCASCHGEDGAGARARRGLEPRLDLTRSPLVTGEARGLVFQRIAYGYSTMPGFSHKLPQGDLEALTAYVMKLRKR